MIKLYTNTDKIRNYKNLIISNDIAFNMPNIIDYIDELCLDYMKVIDGISSFDKNTGVIVTPYGSTTILNISTGLKTLLNMYIHKNKENLAVNVTECGNNVMPYIFRLANDYNIAIVLGHLDIPYKIEYDVIINDSACVKAGEPLRPVIMAQH